MILYASVGISELEIPQKKSLVIYISECKNHCKNCHAPYLHETYGDSLKDNFNTIFETFYNYFEIVCFMGEGKNTKLEHQEFNYYCDIIHKANKKVALYCGRNCNIENWMKCFDYIKVGKYNHKKGPLTNKNTNQILYKKCKGNYVDITNQFWK